MPFRRVVDWDPPIRDYIDGIPIKLILSTHGVSGPGLWKELKKRGIPLRNPEKARNADAATRSAPRRARNAASRLERLVTARIDALETAVADAEPERTDRRLAQLTRTLAQLKGLDADARSRRLPSRDSAGTEAPAGRSLALLRDDLFRRLARLRAEGRDEKRAHVVARRTERAGAAADGGALAVSGEARPAPAGA